MEQAELEQIIEWARIDRSLTLDLDNCQITSLPDSIGSLTTLNELRLRNNHLTSLPDSIGNLSNLTGLDLGENLLDNLTDNLGTLLKLNWLFIDVNNLTFLPESLCNLSDLQYLNLDKNQLNILPDNLDHLFNMGEITLKNNLLNKLPDNIGNLSKLVTLELQNNQLTSLLESIANLSELEVIYLDGNPLADLSALQNIRRKPLEYFTVFCLGVDLSRRYWTKFNEWKSDWLLDENNSEVRRVLIKQLGYEKICEELNAKTCDTWREYTLLKIDEIETVYDRYDEPIDREPMVLLKMTCPSTGHIHILRVPPEMTSAEAAITWVNHGIHPDKFAVQT